MKTKGKAKFPEEEKLALLPLCAICSAKSSGLHFGVNTCEACKAFFRRCLNRRKETPLSCLGNGHCEVNINNGKTLCSSCRYKKCIKNGMSKSAIKTGRYSLERKADLIREAKTNRNRVKKTETDKNKTEVPSSSVTGATAETPGANKLFSSTSSEEPDVMNPNFPIPHQSPLEGNSEIQPLVKPENLPFKEVYGPVPVQEHVPIEIDVKARAPLQALASILESTPNSFVATQGSYSNVSNYGNHSNFSDHSSKVTPFNQPSYNPVTRNFSPTAEFKPVISNHSNYNNICSDGSSVTHSTDPNYSPVSSNFRPTAEFKPFFSNHGDHNIVDNHGSIGNVTNSNNPSYGPVSSNFSPTAEFKPTIRNHSFHSNSSNHSNHSNVTLSSNPSYSPIASNFSPTAEFKPTLPAQETYPSNYSPLTPASSPLKTIPPSPTISTINSSSLTQNAHGLNHRNVAGLSIADASVATCQDLDHIIHLVVTAFDRYGPYKEKRKDKMIESKVQYMEQQEFFQDLFGPTKSLHLEEYLEIYKNTGIDVDGRKEFASKFYSHLDKNLRHLVGFAKCIPGFMDINIDDQIELIRGGSIDWFLIMASTGMDLDSNITSVFGLTFSFDEFCKIHSRIPTALCEMIRLVKALDLDDVSMALLAAVFIIDPDQDLVCIKNKEEVATVQYSLMEALLLHMSRAYSRHLFLFNRTMSVHSILRRERCRLHQDRISSHGQCVKFGVKPTELMNSVVYNKPTRLVESILKDDSKPDVNVQEDKITTMQL